MSLTVATWNINSVRLRIDNVRRMLAESDIDVLCLQETKTIDDLFPAQAFVEAGYPHQVVHGMKGYNGVAIVSRLPFEATGDAENMRSGGTRQWCGKEDCRHAWVRLHHGVEVHSIYIPAGGDIPDPAENVKFAHKLQFLDELKAWLADGGAARGRTILTGDFNVAPLEHDVWSHKQLLKIVSHTPIEVEKLTAMREAGGLVDAVRHFVPESEKLYSWWSYRSANWSLADKGRRLDHVWVTPDLVPHLGAYRIAKETRGWDQPSDHVPVSVRFDGI